MKMKVVDQLHLSSISPHTMGKGHEFEVSDEMAADLEKRGLATRAEGAKAESAPKNKADPQPLNKSDVTAAPDRKSKTKTS